jgi:predicted aconitase/predicted aconitase with swiveling domain
MHDEPSSNMHLEIVYGTPHVEGSVSGELLASNLELSFWGGVDHVTGEVIDRSHPLVRQCLKDKILAIPGGRGSCSGSATILELIMNGNGPRALIFERANEILAVGLFVAEEVFGKKIPMLIVDPEDFKTILGWNKRIIFIQDHCISTRQLETSTGDHYKALSPEHVRPHTPGLSGLDKAMLEGNCDEKSGYTKAHELAMRIIIRTASIMKAPSLISVCQAHVDGAHFGPASVFFGKRLRDLGGKFTVPTTVNAITVDRQRWRDLGVDTGFGIESDELAKVFLDMGAQMSFTCAPYQLDSAPKLGDQVAFGESNVVCYSNSVLGSRTAKYPNMLETLIALTGRAPLASIHLTKNRVPEISISAPSFNQVREPPIDDSFWPLLGYKIGAKAGSRIPIITGFKSIERPPSRDALKAFSAAFATSAGAPMFHMLGVTPEAEQYAGLLESDALQPKISITWQDLKDTWTAFNQDSDSKVLPRTVDLVSLGNPHFSLLELKSLAQLVHGRTKHPSTSVIVTTSRAQHSLATQAGYIAQLDEFGIQVLTDTCWCFIRDPVIKKEARCIMTNSGKYAHYGPGLTGREFCFGSLLECIESACIGRWEAKVPEWLHVGVQNSP